MAENTLISWTDNTWNPWHGCTKVSPGCKFCYMYRDKDRYGQDPTTVIRSKPSTFNSPLQWKEKKRVFTCSWSDFFIEEADEWRADAWKIIRETPHLTYQILTKRPERVAKCLPPDWGEGYPNVWLGVSVENQQMADLRLSILAEVPASLRFVSFEPLLGPVKIKNWEWFLFYYRWFIFGGESGNDQQKDGTPAKYGYRPMQWEWVEDLIFNGAYSQLKNGFPNHTHPWWFVKQSGTYLAKLNGYKNRHGADPEEWPSPMRHLQQFPFEVPEGW